MDCASKFESIEIQNPKKSPSTTWTFVDKRYSTWKTHVFEVFYGLFVHFLVGQLHIEPHLSTYYALKPSKTIAAKARVSLLNFVKVYW
jgi:hypothetical protein